MDEQDYSYDFFLAHAGIDKTAAETLYDLLKPHSQVFLDSQCLELGADWDIELFYAQRVSRVTVVLISSRTERAYYQREEIAAAIAMARRDKDKHRVVPVYLDGRILDENNVPYGLLLKHGLSLTDANGLAGVAQRLLELRSQIRENYPALNEESGSYSCRRKRIRSESGFTALHLAAHKGNATTIKKLIARGADINTSSDDGTTALMCAAMNGHATTVGILVDAGADPMAINDAGETALSLAVEKRHLTAVLALLKKGANATDAEELLVEAIHNNDATLVRQLLDAGLDPNSPRGFSSPLFEAVRRDNTEIVELLLDHGADVNIVMPVGKPVLYLTVSEKMTQLLKPYYGVNDLLIYEIERGNTAQVTMLLQMGANPDAHGAGVLGSAIHRSVINHEYMPELMLLLLDPPGPIGSNEESKRKRKHEALIEAVQYNYPRHVELLLNLGVKPDAKLFALNERVRQQYEKWDAEHPDSGWGKKIVKAKHIREMLVTQHAH